SEYGWSFIGSDIDPIAIASAERILASNPKLANKIECRLQANASETFSGILKKGERIDVSICNPPFHASQEEAQAGTLRKLSNLKNKKVAEPELNFGGKSVELWTEGGERRFILDMIRQSAPFGKSCCWFSTLVSKQSNLKYIYEVLSKMEAVQEYKTIPMGQGNKISRIVAWTFLDLEEEKAWVKERWGR
ncbi:MAG TPA: RlmF-related methyltransferase, partial [Arenibacter sp.]|nr:RlmF-related methyltransferase [Arenibacter sp.]